MPRRRRTERDRIYLERLKHVGPLTNSELAKAVSKTSEFSSMKEAALKKDISRFVRREVGKTIRRDKGRLFFIAEEEQGTRFSFDETWIQIDIRDATIARKLHVCWHEVMRNISDSPIMKLSSEIFSTKPQTLRERNPLVRIEQGSLVKTYSLKDLRIDKESTPYKLRFEVDLPKKMKKGQTIVRTLIHDDRDLAPDFTITDLPPIDRIIFDVIKRETNTEDLDCMVAKRHEREGEYVSEVAKAQRVIDLRTGKGVRALRLTLENPKVGRDYRFEWQR